MTVAKLPDLAASETAAVVDYLPEKFPLVQPCDANARLPRTVAPAPRGAPRRAHDLVNGHAEPHDVAVGPKGNSWVAERAGKLGSRDAATLAFVEVDTPRPRGHRPSEPRQPADRFPRHAVGPRRPQRPLAQL